MSQLLTRLRRIPMTIWYVALLVIAILLPLPLDNYLRAVLWLAGIYVLLGLSLNIIVGYAGQFQLGHAAFYAIGAYTVALLNIYLHVPIFLGMIAAIVVAGAAGYVLTRPILHLRGDYLAIVTIAFGEIVRMLLVNNVGRITGGANGIFGIAQPSIFGFRFHTTLSHYYLVLFFVVITIVAMQRLENSRLGRSWTYVREDELAAEAMGVNTVRVKATAFLLGSACAGRRRLHPRRVRGDLRHGDPAGDVPVREGLARRLRRPGHGADDDLPSHGPLAEPPRGDGDGRGAGAHTRGDINVIRDACYVMSRSAGFGVRCELR
jgi:ribose/xylose/arabinose/galactoside ABC-type transport system permease subunit